MREIPDDEVPPRDSPNPEVRAVQLFLRERLALKPYISILEAGCGSETQVWIRANAYVVGIDVNEDQLQRNEDVDVKILGDIQKYDRFERTFDVVTCWDVLEHLPAPGKALDNMARILSPDGRLVLGMPNVLSVKGLLTKLTPHAFHIWVHRFVYKSPTAGLPNHPPFPTTMRFVIAPGRIASWARASGLEIEYCRIYENRLQQSLRERIGLVGNRWHVLRSLISFVSLGCVDAERTECIMVLKKQGEMVPPRPLS